MLHGVHNVLSVLLYDSPCYLFFLLFNRFPLHSFISWLGPAVAMIFIFNVVWLAPWEGRKKLNCNLMSCYMLVLLQPKRGSPASHLLPRSLKTLLTLWKSFRCFLVIFLDVFGVIFCFTKDFCMFSHKLRNTTPLKATCFHSLKNQPTGTILLNINCWTDFYWHQDAWYNQHLTVWSRIFNTIQSNYPLQKSYVRILLCSSSY